MMALNGHLIGLEKEDLVNGYGMSKIGLFHERDIGAHHCQYGVVMMDK